VYLDDGSGFEELVWMGLVIESVEKTLLMTGVGPLPKLTLLEAESRSVKIDKKKKLTKRYQQ